MPKCLFGCLRFLTNYSFVVCFVNGTKNRAKLSCSDKESSVKSESSSGEHKVKNVSKLFIKIGEFYESSKIPICEWNQRIDSTANIYPQNALVKRAQRDFARLPLYLRG